MKKMYKPDYINIKYPPESIDFLDKRVGEISIAFLKNTLSTHSNITACNNYMLMYRYISQYVAIKISLNTITAKDIRYLLFMISDNQLPNRTLIIKYIYSLLNYEDAVLDDEAISFLNIEPYFYKETSISVIDKILSAKHFSQLYHYKYHNIRILMILNIDSPEILSICKDFIFNYNRVDSYIQDFFILFNKSTINPVVDVNDFTYSLFQKQLYYFRDICKNRNFVLMLCSLYYYIGIHYKPDLFSESGCANPLILDRHDIVGLLYNHYVPILYNRLAPVPEADKWIFDYSNMASKISSRNNSCSRVMDFTSVKNLYFRGLLKKYIWEYDGQLDLRYGICYRLIDFLTYVEQLKTGQELSIYSKPNNEEIITAGEVLAYRSYIKNKIKSAYNNQRVVKQFLMFLSKNEYMSITKDVLFSINDITEPTENTAMPIPDNEITILAQTLLSHTHESIDAALYCVAFYIALETEFRISMIFSLSADCVKETYKANEYVIRSVTKSNQVTPKTFPITLETKQKIDLILSLNIESRENARGTPYYNKLFVSASRRNMMYKSIRVLQSDGFNIHLKKCCKEANIQLYSAENLRDTHMTKATEYLIEQNLSKFYAKYLTDHSSISTTEAHYINIPLLTILESTYGIIIGDINVPGQIYEDLDASYKSVENIVQDSCGYCKSSTCNIVPVLSCLMCPDFVATIDRIPFFEEQIKICDKKLSNATIPHDIEDQINIKRLLLKYLYRLCDLNERTNDNV
jgi:integrase